MQNSVPANHSGLSLIAAGLVTLALGAACLAPQPCFAQKHEGAGLVASGSASAKDVGLPIYPGSKPHQGKSGDSQAARLGLWGGGSGFKLSLVKMDTDDSPEKVAAYYRKALSKYGKVLDCSNPPAQSGAEADDSKALTCGDDKPEKGGMLFKSGTTVKQHIVSIQPDGQGSYYQLVALDNWSKGEKH